jgi:glucose-1-phosphate thymidylyltransferase
VKALVLAGGRGVRLRPITHTSAKQLVPIANKPILFYAIESVVAAGIKEIGMIVGDTEGEVRSAVGDGGAWGATITYIRQSGPLGLAHAVKEAEPYLRGSPFVMYLGDNLVPSGIGGFVEQFERSQPDALVLLAKVRAPERFGVAELHDGRLIRLEEKPKTPRSDLALVGVYLFADRIFEAVHAIKPSARGELEITDAIQWLIDHEGRVEPHVIDSWWRDTGRLEDLLEANRKVLETLQPSNEATIVGQSRIVGNVALGKGVEIVDSVVRGPAIVGARTRIVNSYVGPNTSIGCDVVIERSEIEHSVVLDGSQICDAGVKIEDSLIGKQVVIRRTTALPKALRFMLGDHSEVELT